MIETITKIICDGCGTSIEGVPSNLATLATRSYWDATRKAKTAGWLIDKRSYQRAIHYCSACADKPQQVKSATRKKKCKTCVEQTRAEKYSYAHRELICMGKTRCDVCGWWRKIWQDRTE